MYTAPLSPPLLVSSADRQTDRQPQSAPWSPLESQMGERLQRRAQDGRQFGPRARLGSGLSGGRLE